MFLTLLIKTHFFEKIQNANKEFVALKIYDEDKNQSNWNYLAPFSWLHGILKWIFLPVSVFFKTTIDLCTRKHSKKNVAHAIQLLEANKNDQAIPRIVEAISANEYQSSSSKKLIQILTNDATFNKSKLIDFLNNSNHDGINTGTKLENTICHYTELFCKNDSYSSLAPDYNRRKSMSLTG